MKCNKLGKSVSFVSMGSRSVDREMRRRKSAIAAASSTGNFALEEEPIAVCSEDSIDSTDERFCIIRFRTCILSSRRKLSPPSLSVANSLTLAFDMSGVLTEFPHSRLWFKQ